MLRPLIFNLHENTRGAPLVQLKIEEYIAIARKVNTSCTSMEAVYLYTVAELFALKRKGKR